MKWELQDHSGLTLESKLLSFREKGLVVILKAYSLFIL